MKNRALSLPNALSAFRIVLVPVFICAYFLDSHDIKVYAIGVYAVAGASDFLDGYFARRWGLTSQLGKVLDPLGDKLMQVSVLACITIDGIIPVWAVAAAFVKELLMGVGGLVIHRKRVEIPPSNILGKVATVMFIIVCLALMIFPGIRGRYAAAMIFAAVAMMFMALGSYIIVFISAVKRQNARSGADDIEKG